MKLRRFFLCTVGLLLGIKAIQAQTVTTEQQQADENINVIAYFCKNDTLKYRIQEANHKIADGDTTLTNYISEDFMIIVRDSTSKGYKMEYIPLGNRAFESNDSNLMSKALAEKIGEMSDQTHVMFTTDELGTLQHIENWREVRDLMRKSIKLACDSLYTDCPELDSIMPRQRLEATLNLKYATEESIMGVYDELQLLFSLHGKAFTIGKYEVTDSTGYPSTTNLDVSYGSYDEDDYTDGDYYVIGETTQVMPAEDVANLTKGAMTMLLSDASSDLLNKIKLDSLMGDIKVTIQEVYYLFYNGWPCFMSKRHIEEFNGTRRLTTKTVEWLYRHWGEYDDGSDDNGTQI